MARCSLSPSAVLGPGRRDEQPCEDAAARSCARCGATLLFGSFRQDHERDVSHFFGKLCLRFFYQLCRNGVCVLEQKFRCACSAVRSTTGAAGVPPPPAATCGASSQPRTSPRGAAEAGAHSNGVGRLPRGPGSAQGCCELGEPGILRCRGCCRGRVRPGAGVAVGAGARPGRPGARALAAGAALISALAKSLLACDQALVPPACWSGLNPSAAVPRAHVTRFLRWGEGGAECPQTSAAGGCSFGSPPGDPALRWERAWSSSRLRVSDPWSRSCWVTGDQAQRELRDKK